MNIHEYQAKQLFADYAIPVPAGKPAWNAEQAVERAQALGGDTWMVKAQIHAGGRGKVGGVQRAPSLEQVSQISQGLIGTRLVTHQTTADGQPIQSVLIETPTAIHSELYLSLLIDRAKARIGLIASRAGGMDIEEVAAKTPEQIIRRTIDPVVGIQSYQCREIGFALGLDDVGRKQLISLLFHLYRLFVDKDLSLVEINPLVITEQGQLLALDAKIHIDDNALYRHKELQGLYDPNQEDEKEHRARQFDLNYIALDGNIACMVNGAGLAMATMDVIKIQGGTPANFLDVGGGTTAERVTEAFNIILSDSKVKAILINIFGGIVRCDLIAQGVIHAIKQTNSQLPVIVRLEGTNVEVGKTLLKDSGLSVIPADNLDDAAKKAVLAVKG
jgi:succinyl-CoA synthetase beta subunit